jgi:hypothetical protein
MEAGISLATPDVILHAEAGHLSLVLPAANDGREFGYISPVEGNRDQPHVVLISGWKAVRDGGGS